MKNKFFLFKLACLLASLFGIIIANTKCTQEVIYDVLVSIFSSLILVCCIDGLSDFIQSGRSRKYTLANLRNFDALLQEYIKKYEMYYYCVITPLEDRDFESKSIKSDFTFKDMRDMYQSCVLLTEKTYTSSIEVFLTAEHNLSNEISLLVTQSVFLSFPDLNDILIRFQTASNKFMFKGAIQGYKTITIEGSNEKVLTQIHDFLANDADNIYKEIKNGENSGESNIINQFIGLMNMMKEEQKLIVSYQHEVSKLLDKKNNTTKTDHYAENRE